MNAVTKPNDALLGDIRARVRTALTKSSAYNALPKQTRDEVAFNTVRALHYILGGEHGDSTPGAVTLAGNSAGFSPLAQQQAGVPIPAKGRMTAPAPRPFGEAARRGGEAMANLVKE